MGIITHAIFGEALRLRHLPAKTGRKPGEQGCKLQSWVRILVTRRGPEGGVIAGGDEGFGGAQEGLALAVIFTVPPETHEPALPISSRPQGINHSDSATLSRSKPNLACTLRPA